MGSGTHQFWKERTIIRLFSVKNKQEIEGWEFRTLNQHLGTHQFEILTEPLILAPLNMQNRFVLCDKKIEPKF